MTHASTGVGNETPRPRQSTALLRKWAVPVAGAISGFVVLQVGLPWLRVVTPHWLVIRAGIIFLWILLGAFTLAVPAALIGTAWSWIALARAQRRSDRAAAWPSDEIGRALHELPCVWP